MERNGNQGASAAADRAGGPTDPSRDASRPKALIPSALARFERLLGSSLLSWFCIAIFAVRSDLSGIDYMLLLIPLANYTVKLDQIAQAIEARQRQDPQGLGPTGESAVAEGDAPNT